jgi:hypothetical protein
MESAASVDSGFNTQPLNTQPPNSPEDDMDVSMEDNFSTEPSPNAFVIPDAAETNFGNTTKDEGVSSDGNGANGNEEASAATNPPSPHRQFEVFKATEEGSEEIEEFATPAAVVFDAVSPDDSEVGELLGRTTNVMELLSEESPEMIKANNEIILSFGSAFGVIRSIHNFIKNPFSIFSSRTTFVPGETQDNDAPETMETLLNKESESAPPVLDGIASANSSEDKSGEESGNFEVHAIEGSPQPSAENTVDTDMEMQERISQELKTRYLLMSFIFAKFLASRFKFNLSYPDLSVSLAFISIRLHSHFSKFFSCIFQFYFLSL